jgi:hypothetical protein
MTAHLLDAPFFFGEQVPHITIREMATALREFFL